MASQRAVVTTNVNGIPRLVTYGVNGVVVDTDSVDALHNGIQQLLENPAHCQSLAAAGRSTVEQHFSFEKRMEKIVDVYRSKSTTLAQNISAVATAVPKCELVLG